MSTYSTNQSGNYGFDSVFGDINSVKSSDAYGCLINGFTNTSFGTAGQNSCDYDTSDIGAASTGLYVARPYTGLGGSIAGRRAFPCLVGSQTRSGATGGNAPMTYPNHADGGIYLTQAYIADSGLSVLRGTSPGFYCSGQTIGVSVFASRDKLTGVTGLSGKTLMAVNSLVGVFFFDITGPWR